MRAKALYMAAHFYQLVSLLSQIATYFPNSPFALDSQYFTLTMQTQEIYDQVNRRYGSIVKSSTGQYEQKVAKAFGYTEEELSTLPEGANLGLSCGNPIALARLREVCMSVSCGPVALLTMKRAKLS